MLGDTDSGLYFALITKETDAQGGDVGAGITAAASWIAARLSAYQWLVTQRAPLTTSAARGIALAIWGRDLLGQSRLQARNAAAAP